MIDRAVEEEDWNAGNDCRNPKKMMVLSMIYILHTVVVFLHLSDEAKMFNWVPPLGRGHWSMSTRRKSMSIPLVPLE